MTLPANAGTLDDQSPPSSPISEHLTLPDNSFNLPESQQSYDDFMQQFQYLTMRDVEQHEMERAMRDEVPKDITGGMKVSAQIDSSQITQQRQSRAPLHPLFAALSEDAVFARMMQGDWMSTRDNDADVTTDGALMQQMMSLRGAEERVFESVTPEEEIGVDDERALLEKMSGSSEGTDPSQAFHEIMRQMMSLGNSSDAQFLMQSLAPDSDEITLSNETITGNDPFALMSSRMPLDDNFFEDDDEMNGEEIDVENVHEESDEDDADAENAEALYETVTVQAFAAEDEESSHAPEILPVTRALETQTRSHESQHDDDSPSTHPFASGHDE